MVFDKLIAYVQDPHNQIDFVLVSGDVFESSGTTIPEFLLAQSIFKQLAAHVPVIVTAGNHDELQRGEFQTYWLELLSIPNVRFISKPTNLCLNVRHTEEGKAGPVDILACPWTGIKDQDEFDRYVMQHMNPATEIVMLHECFNGSILDNGKRFPFGIQVPDIPGVRYFACGDIHKPQRLNLKHAWFSGAPMQYTFGDDPEKGFLVVTSYVGQQEMDVKFERLVSPVELIKVYDPAKVDPSSPHWFALECPVDQIPLDRPNNLKRIHSLPVRVDMPEATADSPDTAQQIRVDYAEGVDQVLGDLGYSVDEINEEAENIRRLARI